MCISRLYHIVRFNGIINDNKLHGFLKTEKNETIRVFCPDYSSFNVFLL